jgi:hypothetical protein
VKSKDPANNLATSGDLTFDTKDAGVAPVITQVLPASGATLGNTHVTILGDHFDPELATATTVSSIDKQNSFGAIADQQGSENGVFFGDVKATTVVVINSTRLELITPPSSEGGTSVSIVQSSGTASVPNSYTFRKLPPVPTPAGVKRQEIPFVIDTKEFRTNLGINNVGETEEAVDLLLVDNNGLLVANKSRTVPGHGMTQLNDVLRELEELLGSSPTGREGYLILDSSSSIGSWASQIDNVSQDPSLELGRGETRAASRILLPSSVSNQKFLTSLIVINASETGGVVTIRVRDLDGNIRKSVPNQALPARGYLFFRNLYQDLRIGGEVSGPIEVEATGGIKIVATERIYTPENTSAYFEGVDFGIASKTLVLPYVVDTAEFRTNLGIDNVNGVMANVTVSLVDKNGVVLGNPIHTQVKPHGLVQLNNVIRQLLGRSDVSNQEGTIRLESDQAIIGWTSQIDNLTQDSSLVVAKPSTATKLLIPSTTNSGKFKSTLAVVNLADTSNLVQLTARDNGGNVKAMVPVTIPGRGLIAYTDILTSLGLQSTFGPLEINSLDNKPLVAVSRVYSNQRTGGYFEGVTEE